jgi:hypothetical protein
LVIGLLREEEPVAAQAFRAGGLNGENTRVAGVDTSGILEVCSDTCAARPAGTDATTDCTRFAPG